MDCPSIFTKSPQEHILTEIARRESQVARGLHPLTDPISTFPPPPNGYIQIQFYRNLRLACRQADPDIVANVPLDRGGLDLGRIKALWGLENCVAIDPMRWEEFHTGKEDWLSPLSVHLLSEGQDHIKFIELPVTKSTTYKRLVRQMLITPTNLATLCFTAFSTHPTTLGLVENYYSQPLQRANSAKEKLSTSLSEWQVNYEQRILQERPSEAWYLLPSEYGGLFWMVLKISLTALFIVFVILASTGYLDLEVGERFYNWARTGSVTLSDATEPVENLM